MYFSELTWNSYWWLIPIFMMLLCFFMMRRSRGFGMCCFGPRHMDNHKTSDPDSAIEILDKRYASGEIDKAEYEDIKRTLSESRESSTV